MQPLRYRAKPHFVLSNLLTQRSPIFAAFLTVLHCRSMVSADEKTLTGFLYPTGTSATGGYAGWLASGCDCAPCVRALCEYFCDGREGPEYHIGTDIRAGLNYPVYAIGHGRIIKLGHSGWGAGNSASLIRHTLFNGSPFIAVYGHIQTSLQEGDEVVAGQVIGTIGTWNPTHLHFGVRPGGDVPPAPWGRVNCSRWGPEGPFVNGVVNPIAFIESNVPLGGGSQQVFHYIAPQVRPAWSFEEFGSAVSPLYNTSEIQTTTHRQDFQRGVIFYNPVTGGLQEAAYSNRPNPVAPGQVAQEVDSDGWDGVLSPAFLRAYNRHGRANWLGAPSSLVHVWMDTPTRSNSETSAPS